VLVAVGLLAYHLLSLQSASKPADNPPAAEVTPDPYTDVLDQIQADHPETSVVRIDQSGTSHSLQDTELKYSIIASSVITGIDAADAADNTIIGINLSVENSSAINAFTLDRLTLTHGEVAYDPIRLITTNEKLSEFVEDYPITALSDVSIDDRQDGWVFFEVPKAAVDQLSLTYTRDATLSLDSYIQSIALIAS
jgi:hypothetical protein